MERDFWKNELKWFVVPHPEFSENNDQGDEIYTPKRSYKIILHFTGLPDIQGEYLNLIINFNSDRFIILHNRSNEQVTRLLWSSLSGFSLNALAVNNEPKARLYLFPTKKD